MLELLWDKSLIVLEWPSRSPDLNPRERRAVIGDPHVLTFDGLSYTFNGKGEYTLVHSPDKDLFVLGRTEQVKLQNGTFANATQLSSVAMKERNSDVIEVRLGENPNHLQVLRNHKILSFTEQRWMDLDGVFLFSPCLQNVTVMFYSGVGVEVRRREGTMALTVLLPPDFTTQGLLGQMNFDPSDDLMSPLREVLRPDHARPEDIFIFGQEWLIRNHTPLFTYDSKYLLEAYYSTPTLDPDFVPAFFVSEDPEDLLVAELRKMCIGEGAQLCRYDTLTTRSLAMGNSTLRSYQSHKALIQDLEPVVSCGWQPTPRNGQKKGTCYLEGETLSFSCDEGYLLYGSPQRTCLKEGAWSGTQAFCVTENTLGFVLGTVGSVSALIIMGVIVTLHTRKQDSP
ncbi:sushi domain-containing protein 2 [Aplochiton taeniatus]